MAENCEVRFQWGLTAGYGNDTPWQVKEKDDPFEQIIIDLIPNTIYHFRAQGRNDAGIFGGEDKTLTALLELPVVTTDPATAIGVLSATLNGTLDDDGGLPCECGFEWGETIAYGNITPTDSKVTGESFSKIPTGLTPGQTYHFRAFATNAAGTSYGADRAFTADPLPPATLIPTVTTNPASALAADHATLNGTLDDDGGEVCECGLEWGETIAYGTTTPIESKFTGETFSHRIGGLFPNTEYHFRAFATNSAGTGYGADRSFTSAPTFSRAHALSREEL